MELTADGQRLLGDIAQRDGFSQDAARVVLKALMRGHGAQAQFNHPELGGMGQWSQGGMIMIGDMFNADLKRRVDTLCNDLSDAFRMAFNAAPSDFLDRQPGMRDAETLVKTNTDFWWPAELGLPASSGGQNSTRYAFFPAMRRLAIDEGGQVRLYDSGDLVLTGFSQSQGQSGEMAFTSQFGPVRLADLPEIKSGSRDRSPPVFSAPTPNPPADIATSPSAPQADPLAILERLANLHHKGVLTDEEFATKKAELLNRI